MNVKRVLVSVIAVSVLAFTYNSVSANWASQKALDRSKLAKAGIYLADATAVAVAPSVDEEATIRAAVLNAEPEAMRNAKHVAIQRVSYHFQLPTQGDGVGTAELRTGWLVILDGLSLSGHGPSKVINTQLNVVVSDRGEAIFGYSYQ